MFDRDEADQPPTDGEQFDAVGRFEESGEPVEDEDGSFLGDPPDPTPTSEGVDPRIRFHFWRVLLVFNVAILGLSLGPVLVFLDGNSSLGVPLFVGGAVLFGYGVVRFRQAKAEIEAIVDGDDENAPEGVDEPDEEP